MVQSKETTVFFAFPSYPSEIGDAIVATAEGLKRTNPSLELRPWTAHNIAGRCLIDPILESIDQSEFIAADITHLNFNVVYEIGFAIGRGKRVVLTNNRALENDARLRTRVGIFDTIGYESYANAADLKQILLRGSADNPLSLSGSVNQRAPIYVISPREKTEAEIRLFSRIKKVARLHFRAFDPQESNRLSVRDAIANVIESIGVVVPLLPSTRSNNIAHNIRCAFVAGVSHALRKEVLLLQAGDDPIPLDLRDFVDTYNKLSDIDSYVAAFAPRITERLQEVVQAECPVIKNPLQALFIGESAAENEFLELSLYYLPVDAYNRVLGGSIQVVTGRKGSGKTALFFQVRDKIRSNKQNIVLDLNPEGFQLRKLKTIVLDHLEEGTREHTITAFWEYLLLLEICYKLLDKDRQKHHFDHTIRDQYIALQKAYMQDRYVSEGDFAERLLRITEEIEVNFREVEGASKDRFLVREKITEVIYCHDLQKLRSLVTEYLQHKQSLWILFDNLDKGWSAHGIEASDLLILRCLLEALRKLKRDLSKHDVEACGVVFVRNDVYELLVESSPDRGKTARVALDWNDDDLLRDLLRRRFISNLPAKNANFQTLWNSAVVSHIDGEETSGYLIARSLMRPRCLLELIQHCKSHAVNLGREKIEEEDILWAEKTYSTDLIQNVELEIQDILPEAGDCLYAFIESPALLDAQQLAQRLDAVVPKEHTEKVVELLLWYGVLGILRSTGEQTFIYDVNCTATIIIPRDDN